MKHTTLQLEPGFVRPEQAAEFPGSQSLLTALESAGKLKPKVRRNRLTLYAVADLKRMAELINAGVINLDAITDCGKAVSA